MTPGRPPSSSPEDTRLWAQHFHFRRHSNSAPSKQRICRKNTTASRVLTDGKDVIQASELQDPPQYACLSYRWREVLEGVLTTTASNIRDHFRGIHVDRLPKTIMDAITVCRALDIAYLWVDALCIIQEDPDDFALEVARMDEIYANSHLTIYAKHAMSCKDDFLGPQTRGSQGWQRLSSVHSPSGRQCFIRTEHADENHAARHVAALDTRGWCFQESMLPRRQLMYYGDEMVWKCQHSYLCECGHVLPDGHAHPAERSGLKRTWDDIMPPWMQTSDFSFFDHVSVWKDLVQDYSPRLLTRPTDKLAAVSGLARRLYDRSSPAEGSGGRDTFHAGLWGRNFVEQLSWVPTWSSPRRRLDNDVPTSSWASIEGAVAYNSVSKGHFSPLSLLAQIRNVVCSPVHLDNPFGPVQAGGYLDISPPLLPVKLAVLDEAERPGTLVYLMRGQGTRTPWIEVEVDVDAEISPLFRDPSERRCPSDRTYCFARGCAC